MSEKPDNGKMSQLACDGKLHGERPLKPITGILLPDAWQQPQNSSAKAKEGKSE